MQILKWRFYFSVFTAFAVLMPGISLMAQPCADNALETYYDSHKLPVLLNFVNEQALCITDLKEVDLKGFCPPVLDQGTEGSCNGWAIGYGFMSFRYNRDAHITPTGLDTDNVYSPQYLFNLTRCLKEVSPGTDCRHGTNILNCLDVFKNFGCCKWRDFPLNQTPISCLQAPSMNVIEKALSDTVTSYSIITYGNESKPFKSLIKCFKFFLQHQVPIVVQMERSSTMRRDYLAQAGSVRCILDSVPRRRADGWHTSLCVGYRDSDQTFLFQNHFGTQWADGGFIRVPYRVLFNDIDGAYVCTDKNGTYGQPYYADTSMLVPFPKLKAYVLREQALVDVADFKVGLEGLSDNNTAARFVFYYQDGARLGSATLLSGQGTYLFYDGRKIVFKLNTVVGADGNGRAGADIDMSVMDVKPSDLAKFNKYKEQQNTAE